MEIGDIQYAEIDTEDARGAAVVAPQTGLSKRRSLRRRRSRARSPMVPIVIPSASKKLEYSSSEPYDIIRSVQPAEGAEARSSSNGNASSASDAAGGQLGDLASQSHVNMILPESPRENISAEWGGEVVRYDGLGSAADGQGATLPADIVDLERYRRKEIAEFQAVVYARLPGHRHSPARATKPAARSARGYAAQSDLRALRAGGRQVARTFGAAEELSAAMDGFGGASRAASSSAVPAAAGRILGARQASRGTGRGRRGRGAADQPGSQIAGATSRLRSADDFDLALGSAPSSKARQPARPKGRSPARATKPGYDADAATGTRTTHDLKFDSLAGTAFESNAKNGTKMGATGRLDMEAEVRGPSDGGADDSGTDADDYLGAGGRRGSSVGLVAPVEGARASRSQRGGSIEQPGTEDTGAKSASASDGEVRLDLDSPSQEDEMHALSPACRPAARQKGERTNSQQAQATGFDADSTERLIDDLFQAAPSYMQVAAQPAGLSSRHDTASPKLAEARAGQRRKRAPEDGGDLSEMAEFSAGGGSSRSKKRRRQSKLAPAGETSSRKASAARYQGGPSSILDGESNARSGGNTASRRSSKQPSSAGELPRTSILEGEGAPSKARPIMSMQAFLQKRHAGVLPSRVPARQQQPSKQTATLDHRGTNALSKTPTKSAAARARGAAASRRLPTRIDAALMAAASVAQGFSVNAILRGSGSSLSSTPTSATTASQRPGQQHQPPSRHAAAAGAYTREAETLPPMLAAHAQLQARMHRDQSRAADHGGGAITTTQMLPATLRAAIERARGSRAEASQGAFAAGGKLPIASMKTGASLSSPTQASAAIAPSGESSNAETSGVQLAALAVEQGYANDHSKSNGYWQQQRGEAGQHQHHVAVGGSSVRGNSGSPTRRLARGKQAKAGPLVAMLARCWRQTAQDAALLDHYHMQHGARKHPSPTTGLAPSFSSSSASSASGAAGSPVLKETRAPQHRPWVVLEAIDSRCVGPHAWVRCLLRATSDDDGKLKRSSVGGQHGREGADRSGAGEAGEEEDLLQSMLDQEDATGGGSKSPLGLRLTAETHDAERLPAAAATAPTAAARPTAPTEPASSCMARGLTPKIVGLAAGQEVVALFGASRWSWLCSAGRAPAWLRAGTRGEDARSRGSGFQAKSVAVNVSGAMDGDGEGRWRERAGFCVRVHGPFSVLTKGSEEGGGGQNSLKRVGAADPGGAAGASSRSKGVGREERRGLPVLLSTAMSVAVRTTVCL